MKALLKKLTETFSPSGYEGAIREVILAEIESLAGEIRVDALGNIIARKGSHKKNGKRIMIAAHMDEIGLIATHIDDNGFIRFTTVGIPYRRYLPGGRVRFMDGTIGIINSERLEKVSEALPPDKMFIDVGATSVKECPVRAGDVAGFERPFVEMGSRLAAKSLDGRAGVAVAIETMRKLNPVPNEIIFVFTVQEEVGVRGATVSAYGIDPEIGLAIDVTPSGDTPNAVRRDMMLGKGPAIKVKDKFMLADPRVVDWMTRTADQAGIPTQREVLTGGGTDARAIQTTRSGVLAGGLLIPCRYVHSPSEMVDISDLENAVKLLTLLLESPVEFN